MESEQLFNETKTNRLAMVLYNEPDIYNNRAVPTQCRLLPVPALPNQLTGTALPVINTRSSCHGFQSNNNFVYPGAHMVVPLHMH